MGYFRVGLRSRVLVFVGYCGFFRVGWDFGDRDLEMILFYWEIKVYL